MHSKVFSILVIMFLVCGISYAKSFRKDKVWCSAIHPYTGKVHIIGDYTSGGSVEITAREAIQRGLLPKSWKKPNKGHNVSSL